LLPSFRYCGYCPDDGGIIIDLGEGGLGVQSVVPVRLDGAVRLKFKAPRASAPIETQAEVAWLYDAGS
jgi:hypothetical protein